MEIKFRELKSNEIECRVQSLKESGAVLLLYKTSWTDKEILDETVGPENWWNDYKEIKGNLFCGITVLTDKGAVTKWDCGIESRKDGGNEKKGEASDAFKRAGSCWGIGRALYSAPFIFIPASMIKLDHDRNGNLKNFETFYVSKIAYENGKISGIAIRNARSGERVFTWQKKN